jgi:flagellar motor switch protein FliN/FliY
MPIAGLLELAPGAVLALGENAQEGVRLFAEDISIGRGRPGASGRRRAIKIESTGEPPTHADTYASLGRAELQRARAHAEGETELPSQSVLRSIFVRVWAELGRTHLPLGQALALSAGAVLELDQGAQEPVELFANGLCFANGSLVVTPEGEWGVLIAELIEE